jgi:serine/threonine-protein kinase RsbW
MAKLMKNILSACGDYQELEEIRSYVRDKAIEYGLEENKVNKITLAVDEACSNLIHYNINFDKNKRFTINIDADKTNFSVLIKDDGVSFDLNKVESPNMEKYFQEYRNGGLGIHIIKKIVDKIEYLPSNSKSNTNILKLTMFL